MVARAASVGVLAFLAACSSKPRPEDATTHTPAAPVRDAALAVGSAAGSAAAGVGDLQVRVEWIDVPVAWRSSPGRTPCNTPRTPAIAPTTTWGVPDALVVVDGAPVQGSEPPPPAHVVLADCTLAPRMLAGAAALAITSAADRPAVLALRKYGTDLAHLAPGAPIAIQLPIAGHTVTAALAPGAIYALATDAVEPEVAFVATQPGAVVSEANGQVTVHRLAAGPHAVTAWLPPRAGQPARIGHATAKLVAGELAEITVRLEPEK